MDLIFTLRKQIDVIMFETVNLGWFNAHDRTHPRRINLVQCIQYSASMTTGLVDEPFG